jgi:hypothetical protein
MILIPNNLLLRYVAHLKSRGIEVARYAEYKKWLRFYLDFCDKYPVPEQLAERVRLFTDKLRSKKQSEAQLKSAAHAVSLYYEMQRGEGLSSAADERKSGAIAPEYPNPAGLKQIEPTKQAERKAEYTGVKPAVPAAPTSSPRRFAANRSNFSVAGYAVTTNSPEWDAVLAAMADEITLRHYSRKTLPANLCPLGA